MKLFDLAGKWQCQIPGYCGEVTLPGTLDENGVGFQDAGSNQWHADDASEVLHINQGGPILTRLTRRYTYEGPAVFSRWITLKPEEGKRMFLECERSRHLALRVNGQDVPPVFPGCISAPYVFEVTDLLTGHDLLEFVCDNSYPLWPRGDILYSSAATDETQTNWNGILGYLRLREEEEVFIQAVQVFPRGNTLDVRIDVCASQAWQEPLLVSCAALSASGYANAEGAAGLCSVWLRGLLLKPDVRRWDEEEGFLYELTVSLGSREHTVSFGVRDFAAREGHLLLNGRRIFLRSEANCAVFPEEGHPPMSKAAWRQVLETYRSYGVNCMRFHSHCPPEAAFAAADEMGMLMQPELSHWNPKDAFATEESRRYYRDELTAILRMLANHPSFVMLTLGNELHTDEDGHAAMDELLCYARSLDDTRLYAEGSNNHYGQRTYSAASDFFTASEYKGSPLRAVNACMQGWLNQQYPDWRTNYAKAVQEITAECGQPVFSFEVGQYEVLPDFNQLADYRGVTAPANIRHIQEQVHKRGMMPGWKRRVEATGELALRCYRAEVEAALRTPGLSGISLLGLQDFPGQGTALVGMLNPHLKSKPFPFAEPARFAKFFRGMLPLVQLERFTYTGQETLQAALCMANYAKHDLCGDPVWSLSGGGIALSGQLSPAAAPAGTVSHLGMLHIELPAVQHASELTLTISYAGHDNTYPIWVYPEQTPVCPEQVYECRTLDARALEVLARGGNVYLAPDSTKEALPHSIKGQFSTDFWSVGTFPAQEGGMGQLINHTHPLFDDFPTSFHTDWQWWPMASQRAVILPEAYSGVETIITEMDSYAYLRPMAQLLECRCGGGRLMLSTLALHNLMQYPEARALQASIYRYMASGQFAPAQDIPPEIIRSMVT